MKRLKNLFLPVMMKLYYISLPLFKKKTLRKQNFLVLLLCSKKILENFMETIKVGFFFLLEKMYITPIFLGRRKKYM